MKLNDLNDRIHGWLDDHELTKFCFAMGLSVFFSSGISLGSHSPWPLPVMMATTTITGVIMISRIIYLR
jgi:hypothetical protein